jgi:hypothetical protein
MTTLFDATARRNPNRTFGRGLLRSLPTFKAPASAEDMAWASQALADEADRRRTTAYDREIDRRAAEALATDAYCRGCLPL